jgi:hypothetical protein
MGKTEMLEIIMHGKDMKRVAMDILTPSIIHIHVNVLLSRQDDGIWFRQLSLSLNLCCTGKELIINGYRWPNTSIISLDFALETNLSHHNHWSLNVDLY